MRKNLPPRLNSEGMGLGPLRRRPCGERGSQGASLYKYEYERSGISTHIATSEAKSNFAYSNATDSASVGFMSAGKPGHPGLRRAFGLRETLARISLHG